MSSIFPRPSVLRVLLLVGVVCLWEAAGVSGKLLGRERDEGGGGGQGGRERGGRGREGGGGGGGRGGGGGGRRGGGNGVRESNLRAKEVVS